MDDAVRVFFSTRSVDAKGKYLSHVAFVDLTRDLSRVLRVSSRPVMPLGKLGCFDEHGIFPLNVVRVAAAVYGYTCGWSRRVSVSVETAIGLAISQDNGQTFERIGDGPVMAATLREPFLVGDPFVRFIQGRFHMWYIFGTSWQRFEAGAAPDRTYKIGHATSDDGRHWAREGGVRIIPDRLGVHESQALPTVLEGSGRYYMLFCYRESFDFRTGAGRGYRLGYAWSKDLSNWTRDDEQAPPLGTHGEWDSQMMCYPHLFECDGRVYALYNGNEFGRHGFGVAVLESWT
jgi:predicted GH43/DUF377 family glycosyl hydrolase